MVPHGKGLTMGREFHKYCARRNMPLCILKRYPGPHGTYGECLTFPVLYGGSWLHMRSHIFCGALGTGTGPMSSLILPIKKKIRNFNIIILLIKSCGKLIKTDDCDSFLDCHENCRSLSPARGLAPTFRGEFCSELFSCTFGARKEDKGWICKVLYVRSSGVLTRALQQSVGEKIDAQPVPSSDGAHGYQRPRVRCELYILPLAFLSYPSHIGIHMTYGRRYTGAAKVRTQGAKNGFGVAP